MAENLNQSQLIPAKKKREYLESLHEDEFRDRVVRPLFVRQGYGDGRDLCGPDEEGKDALFTYDVPIGGQQIIAVQTKRGKVNLSGKASENLLNAIAQIRTALNTKIPFHASKKKCYPDFVYLCASGKINAKARERIVDEVSDPRIKFLDGEDLIPLVDKYLQELWLGIDVDIMPYFWAIKEYVEGSETDSARFGDRYQSPALMTAATDSSFVPLNLFRTTIKRRKKKGVVHADPSFEEMSVEKVADQNVNCILMTGEAGSGKSTAVLRVAYKVAIDSIKNPDKYKVPVLVRAVDVEENSEGSLIEYLDRFTRKIGKAGRACFSIDDLHSGRMVLFVDGLDEVSNHAAREEVLSRVNDFSAEYPKVKIILTARPYQFIHELSVLAGYRRYQISPLNWAGAEKIVVNIQKGKEIPDEQRKELLRRMEQVHGIELNPLLVSVFAATSEYSKQDLPANITELFKKFTELMLGRWDEEKGLSQQYQARLKDHVLCQVAFGMHKNGATSIKIEELDERIEGELRRVGYRKSNVAEIRDEIVIRSGLFRSDGENVAFRHHLLQEFFAGRGIPKNEFVFTVVSSDWWRRPIVFFFGENPDELGRVQELVNGVSDVAAEERVDTAMTVGLAIQACYLSDVEEKVALWKWVVDSLVVNRESAIAEIEGAEKLPLTTFIYFYMNGRDSVALAHVQDWLDRLDEWACTEEWGEAELDEGRRFWLIAALIETGDVDSALERIQEFDPTDKRYLLALHLGAFLCCEVRPIGQGGRRTAERICEVIEPQIAELRKQVSDEFGSQLLELRQGKVEVIENEK